MIIGLVLAALIVPPAGWTKIMDDSTTGIVEWQHGNAEDAPVLAVTALPGTKRSSKSVALAAVDAAKGEGAKYTKGVSIVLCAGLSGYETWMTVDVAGKRKTRVTMVLATSDSTYVADYIRPVNALADPLVMSSLETLCPPGTPQ